jgi:DNA polymerase-1
MSEKAKDSTEAKCTACDKCRFKKTGQSVPWTGNPTSSVIVLDGSPERAAFDLGIYDMSSEANKYLHKLFDLFGLKEEEYYRTHTLKCGYMTKTGNYSPPTKKELDCCKPILNDELSKLDPKFVLILGKTAVKQIFGNLNIDKIRGNPINREGITYLATYSPEELVVHEGDLNLLSKKCADFAKDIQKFVGLYRGTVKQAEFNYKIISSETDFNEMIDIAKETGVCAIDIETNRLEPFFDNAEILSIAFTPRENESYVLMLSWPGSKYFDLWNYEPLFNVHLAILMLKDFLSDSHIKKVFHRAQFDIMWIEEVLDAKVNNIGDTLVMLALIDSECSKKLKDCARKYTTLGDYEYDAQLYTGAKDKDFTKIPPDALARYNAGDTDVTIRIYHKFKKKLEDLGLMNLYESFVIPNMRSLIKLQRDGIKIDVEKCRTMRTKYEGEMERLYNVMKELPAVIELERITGKPFKPTSSMQCMAIAYGGTVKTTEAIPRAKGEKGTKKYYEAEINGYPGIKPVMIGKPKKDEVTGKTEWKETKSLDKDAMMELFKDFYKGPEYRSKIEMFEIQDFPIHHPIFEFLKPLALYKTYGTQLSNHIIPFINLWGKSKDQCVHANYNISGARTGRLSSSAPNLQNIAKIGFVKETFCSRWGDEGFLIEADYKMLELFVWAFFSLDPNFTRVLREGLDIHKKVAAEMVFNVPVDQITKGMRNSAKKFTFGIPYGKSSRTIAKDLDISVETAEAALNSFFAEFPGNKVWIDDIERFAQDNGYVETKTGRRRLIDFSDDYKKANRRAANSPIQGTASDICVFSKRRLDSSFADIQDKAVVCGTVHDSIIIDAKREVGKEIMELTKYLMENPGFKWITVPLQVEIKYGTNLRDMIEYKEGDELTF